MKRMDIKNIVNRLASGLMDCNVTLAYELIFNYCKENGTRPNWNDYTLENGVLFINGEGIDRIAPLPRATVWTEEGYRTEGLILAAAGH